VQWICPNGPNSAVRQAAKSPSPTSGQGISGRNLGSPVGTSSIYACQHGSLSGTVAQATLASSHWPSLTWSSLRIIFWVDLGCFKGHHHPVSQSFEPASAQQGAARLGRLDPRILGVAGVILAGLAGIFQGSAFYTAFVFAWPAITRGAGPTSVRLTLILALVGLASTLVAAALGMLGGWWSYLRRPTGRRALLGAAAVGILGWVLLGFVGLGNYTFTGGPFPGPLFWIVLLGVGGGVIWFGGSAAGDARV
jgi:hypothetical protein